MDNTFTESMTKFIRDKLRNVHTVKPCVVTKITGNRVSVKPLTATKYHDGSQFDLPILDDVPLMIYSANMGGARITVPITVGDTVIVLCSDRDTGDMMNTKITKAQAFPADEITPLELYPILAIPCFYTIPSEKAISTTDIVIENGSTKISVKPDGDIDLETTANINANAGGNVDITSGGDTNITAEGTVNVSAAETMTIKAPTSLAITTALATFTGAITATGPITGSALFAPIIAPSAAPTETNLLGHVHFYDDDGTTEVTGEPLPSGSTPPPP